VTPAAPVLLLDSASLWFRAFHALPESIGGPGGAPVNAVHGFLDTCSRLIVDRRPRGLVCCLDADWRPEFRVAALPSYKAHRCAAGGAGGAGGAEDVPPALTAQLPWLREVIDAAGLATAGIAGYEADDVIAALADRLEAPVEIVTGDRDLFQLTRQGVTVLYTVQGLRRYGPAEVAERFAIPEGTYADFAMLRGDASDGLPGVSGIGDKTAAALLRRFAGVEALRAAARDGDESLAAGVRDRLLAAEDYLIAADTVVRLRADIGVPSVDPALPAEPADPGRLAELTLRLGIGGPVSRLGAALGWPAVAATSGQARRSGGRGAAG
jgi:5'-3' exonuclease